MIETLATLGADEAQTMYGLLAEEMLVAPDKSSITFRLNAKARFSNGDPVTQRRREVQLRHADQPSSCRPATPPTTPAWNAPSSSTRARSASI